MRPIEIPPDATITTLKQLLRVIETRITFDPRLLALKKEIRQEYKPKVDEINRAIERLQSNRPAKKPRWPETTPAGVVEACNKFWSGTTEFDVFRIHAWNDAAIVTSYPSGAYWTNGGRQAAPARYFCISRTQTEGGKPKRLGEKSGRVSPMDVQELLNPTPE